MATLPLLGPQQVLTIVKAWAIELYSYTFVVGWVEVPVLTGAVGCVGPPLAMWADAGGVAVVLVFRFLQQVVPEVAGAVVVVRVPVLAVVGRLRVALVVLPVTLLASALVVMVFTLAPPVVQAVTLQHAVIGITFFALNWSARVRLWSLLRRSLADG
jgi:hypothetical protein